MFSYIIVNKTISGMGMGGIAINIIGIIIVLILSIQYKRLELLLLLFILNIIVGPFLLINFKDLDLSSIGRIDFFIGNLFFLYFIFNKGKNIVFPLILDMLIVISSFYNFQNLIEHINILYAYISKVSIGYFFYYYWINYNKYNKKYILQIIFYILLIHLFFSLIQFIYPIYPRASASGAGLTIMGHMLNRPLGLLAASFVYGASTIFILMFYIKYKIRLNIIDKIVLVLLVTISMVSTRSVILSTLIFCLYIIFKQYIMKYKTILLFSIISIIFIVIGTNSSLAFLDKSNATKILLWYLAIHDLVTNSSLLQILFGHGIETAANLMDTVEGFVNITAFSLSYSGDALNAGHIHLHNIFVQLIYEHGIIIFIFFNIYIYKVIKFILHYKNNINIEIFLFFTILINYSLHNGIFTPFLTAILLILLHYKKYGVQK